MDRNEVYFDCQRPTAYRMLAIAKVLGITCEGYDLGTGWVRLTFEDNGDYAACYDSLRS